MAQQCFRNLCLLQVLGRGGRGCMWNEHFGAVSLGTGENS